jgi:hypothetical protein
MVRSNIKSVISKHYFMIGNIYFFFSFFSNASCFITGPTMEGFENEIMKFNSPRNDRSQMFQSSISEVRDGNVLQN